MRTKQRGWNLFRNQSGDTIVEVMIAITVISVVLTGAFVVSQKSSSNVQDSQEHTMAQQVLQGQVEKLRNILGGADRSTATKLTALSNAGTSFCMLDDYPFFVSSGASQCLSSATNIYNLKITQVGTTYKFNATWDHLGGGKSTENMYYRVYASNGAITTPDTDAISGQYFPNYIDVDSNMAAGTTGSGLFTGLYKTGVDANGDKLDDHWKLINAYKSNDNGVTASGTAHCQTVAYSNFGNTRIPLPIYPSASTAGGYKQWAQIVSLTASNMSSGSGTGYSMARSYTSDVNGAAWIGLDSEAYEGPGCSNPSTDTYYVYQLAGGFNIDDATGAVSSYPDSSDPNKLKLVISALADDRFKVYLNGSAINSSWIQGTNTVDSSWWHTGSGAKTVTITDPTKFKSGNNTLEIRTSSGPNRAGLLIKDIELSGRADSNKL